MCHGRNTYAKKEYIYGQSYYTLISNGNIGRDGFKWEGGRETRTTPLHRPPALLCRKSLGFLDPGKKYLWRKSYICRKKDNISQSKPETKLKIVPHCKRRYLLPEKDILNSRIIFLKIQPRIFFLATRVLFLQQEFYSWDKSFLLGARFFLTLTHYRPALPFGNRKVYFRGPFHFSIVTI